MKTATLLLLVLSCTACGRQPKVLLAAANDLPVGHVIQKSDLMTTKNGPHWTKAYFPDPSRTDDYSRVVGHVVIHDIHQFKVIDLGDVL